MCSGVECTNQRDIRGQSPSEAVYIKPFSLLAMHTLLEVNFIYNWFATTNTFWIEMKVNWVTFTINLAQRCFLFISVLVSKTLIQIIYLQYLCDSFWCFSLGHYDSCLGLSIIIEYSESHQWNEIHCNYKDVIKTILFSSFIAFCLQSRRPNDQSVTPWQPQVPRKKCALHSQMVSGSWRLQAVTKWNWYMHMVLHQKPAPRNCFGC